MIISKKNVRGRATLFQFLLLNILYSNRRKIWIKDSTRGGECYFF